MAAFVGFVGLLVSSTGIGLMAEGTQVAALAALALAIASVIASYRASTLAVRVEPDVLVIRNIFLTRTLPWSRIEAFAIDPVPLVIPLVGSGSGVIVVREKGRRVARIIHASRTLSFSRMDETVTRELALAARSHRIPFA